MKKTVLLLIAGFVLFSCNQAPVKHDNGKQTATEDTLKDGIFIHISEGYDDPHRVLMPLKMATLMADDKDVLVYMDIHAVELLVKNAKDLEYKGFESAQTYLKKLLDEQVGIYACPACLKVAGFEPDNLMERIQVAYKDKFFGFTEGRIITLDY